eukprot:29325-Pelagococcus_subviridis.AAC.2
MTARARTRSFIDGAPRPSRARFSSRQKYEASAWRFEGRNAAPRRRERTDGSETPPSVYDARAARRRALGGSPGRRKNSRANASSPRAPPPNPPRARSTAFATSPPSSGRIHRRSVSTLRHWREIGSQTLAVDSAPAEARCSARSTSTGGASSARANGCAARNVPAARGCAAIVFIRFVLSPPSPSSPRRRPRRRSVSQNRHVGPVVASVRISRLRRFAFSTSTADGTSVRHATHRVFVADRRSRATSRHRAHVTCFASIGAPGVESRAMRTTAGNS